MIHPSVVLYPNVHIGKNVEILPGAVIGRLPMANGNINRQLVKAYLPVLIEDNVIIGANSVIYTGVTLRENVVICDLSSIREGCVLGKDVLLGRNTMLGYDVQVGDRSRIMDSVHVAGGTILEEDVFFGHMCYTAEDTAVYKSRFGLVPTNFKSPILRKKCLIGAGSGILPDLEIGEGAVVAAGSIVTKTVAPYTIVRGIPAVYWKDVNISDREAVQNETWLKTGGQRGV